MVLTRLMRRDVIRRMLILLHVIVMNIVRFLDRVLDRVLVVYGSWTHILSPADRANYVLPATERTLLEEMQCSLANCELDDDDDDDDDESQVHQRCIWTMAAHIYKRLYENSRRFPSGKPQQFPPSVTSTTATHKHSLNTYSPLHVNRNARTNAPYHKRNRSIAANRIVITTDNRDIYVRPARIFSRPVFGGAAAVVVVVFILAGFDIALVFLRRRQR
jgi:hypothetical protein